MENTLLSLSNDVATLVEQCGPAVVAIHSDPRAAASGVHWRPGVIVTAAHTQRRDDEIRIVTSSGEELKAEMAGRDAGTDLAVLKIAGFDGPTASIPSTAPATRPGEFALVLGRSRNTGITAALGIVSSVGPAWQTWRGGRLDRYIRLDVAVYHGASGGAVVDTSGRVIGIATAALSRTSPIAIPVETVNRVADSLLAHGTVPRGFIGVGLQPVRLPEHLKTKLNLSHDLALIVVSVHPGGPAEQAGIMMGDLLLEIAGKAVKDTDDIQEALDAGSVGQTMHARVVRGGALADVDITVGQRPRRSC